MIQPEEVSRNNLLMQGDDIATVRGLPADDFIQYSIESRDNDIIYGEPRESFKPIPLTEKWLQDKFGLPKRQVRTDSPYFQYSIRANFEIYCFMDGSGNCLFYGETMNIIEEDFFIIKCDTVHMFQNIYAILNPHEKLTIK